MSLPTLISMRYITSRSGSHLVSFLSRLSMMGLVMGVALLITVLSVMNGFDREMRTRILGLVPHITIKPTNADADWREIAALAKTHEHVIGAAPFVELTGMLIKGRDVETAAIYGLDPEQERSVSRIGQFIDLDMLTGNAVVLGSGLFSKLSLEEGSRLSLALPASEARGKIQFKSVRAVGQLHTGTELDQSLVLVNLEFARSLVSADTPISVRITVDDVFAAPRIGYEVGNTLPYPAYFNDWTGQFGNMYQAIQLSRQMVGILLLSVVAVAVFNVISTLVMVVNDKQADIGILRSQGATPPQILKTFMLYGALIGLVGALVGGFLGALLASYITNIVGWVERFFNVQFLQSDVYPISYLPSDLRLVDVLIVCSVAWLMSFLATIYPAWRASKIMPAEALRSAH